MWQLSKNQHVTMFGSKHHSNLYPLLSISRTNTQSLVLTVFVLQLTLELTLIKINRFVRSILFP